MFSSALGDFPRPANSPEAATLKRDLRFYREGDAKDALDLSGRITRELRSQGPQAARDTAWRTFAVLAALYAEVARGAHFLLREAGLAAFPPLYAICRTTPKRREKTPPAPPSKLLHRPSTNADHLSPISVGKAFPSIVESA